MSKSSPVVSVRVSAGERRLLESAAERSRTNLSDFVRRKALEAAELEQLSQTTVVIPSADWERFEAWASRPAEVIAPLRELAEHAPPWRK